MDVSVKHREISQPAQRRKPKPLICTGCHAEHRRTGQRYCLACHAAANARYRERLRALIAKGRST